MNIKTRGLFPLIGDQFDKFGTWLLAQFASVKAFLFGQPEHGSDGESNDRLYKFVTIASVTISMFLIAINLIGSFTAMRSFAEENGIASSVAMWIPIAVDGFVSLGILVIFGASLVGNRVGWVKLVVFVCMILSAFFNVEHVSADQKNLEHLLLGSIFPLGVYLTSEITAGQIRHYITRRGSLLTNAQLSTQITALETQQATLGAEIETEQAQLLTAARRSVGEAVAELEERRAALTSQNEGAARRLKKLKANISAATQTNITTEDIQIALWIGQDSAISGREIGERLKKSSQTGITKKNRVKGILNGGKRVSSNNSNP